MLKRYKKELIYLILEDWEGNREVGSPSPPFKKGESSSITNIVNSISDDIHNNTVKSLQNESYENPAKSLTEYLMQDWRGRKNKIREFSFIVDNNIVQGGCVYYKDEKTIKIGLLTVHPSQMTSKTKSNKGIGSKLLLNILKKAYIEKKDIEVQPLDTAIKFYEKFGFSKPNFKGTQILSYKKLKEVLKERKK